MGNTSTYPAKNFTDIYGDDFYLITTDLKRWGNKTVIYKAVDLPWWGYKSSQNIYKVKLPYYAKITTIWHKYAKCQDFYTSDYFLDRKVALTEICNSPTTIVKNMQAFEDLSKILDVNDDEIQYLIIRYRREFIGEFHLTEKGLKTLLLARCMEKKFGFYWIDSVQLY